ncbi:MAG: hypothetical protein K8S27_01230 [Candidatus Omnitrophica bacterium]|nr:hypothetical protein [Candidatus Omnitrophota bacterium]
MWHRDIMERMIASYAQEAQKRAVLILTGECGINDRSGFIGEDHWADNMVCLY